jgi:hypothetical protein
MRNSAFDCTVNASLTVPRCTIARNAGAFVVALVTFVTVNAFAQTNASKASAVGTWKLDLQHSDVGSDPPPKSVTLTILKDTPQMDSWRVDVVDDKGKALSYSWSGPQDGTMHPVTADGKEAGNESLKRDSAGALLRHGEEPDGSSFDGHATLSADGNTIIDVVTSKSKDGKVEKTTWVYRRVSAAK